MTHFAGCAVLFNKETFHSDIKVTPVYLHDTRDQPQQVVKEGQSGWIPKITIAAKIITVLTRYRPIVVELV